MPPTRRRSFEAERGHRSGIALAFLEIRGVRTMGIRRASDRMGRLLSRCIARANGTLACAPGALMRRVATVLLTLVALPCHVPAALAEATAAAPLRVAAVPSRGFAFPYFLVVPDTIE